MTEIIILIILLTIFLFLFKESFNIENVREIDPMGADGFPRIILGILIVLLVIALVKAIKNKEKSTEKISKDIFLQFVGIIGSILVFVIAIEFLGFLISSIFLTLALLLVLGERKKKRMILLTIIVPIGFTLVFGQLLSVPLPRGMGIFQELSRFIY